MSVLIYDAKGQPYDADLIEGDQYRKLERELAEIRSAWKEREPQLYAAEREVESLRGALAAERAKSTELTAELKKWKDASEKFGAWLEARAYPNGRPKLDKASDGGAT